MKAILTNSILALLLCIGVDSSSARIINVPDDEESIQAGIDAAEDGDTVLVHPGTYVENIDFIGKNIVVGSLYLTSGDTAYVDSTVIDGDSLGSVVTFANGEGRDALLTGVTIRNGTGTIEEYINYNLIVGGGVYCFESFPTLRRNNITQNSASEGGGVGCSGASPKLIGCLVLENDAHRGAGLWNSGNSILDDCRFLGNSADTYGGGVLTERRITINNCLFENNSAIEGGGFYGGLFLYPDRDIMPGVINITGSTFINNTAEGFGGGLYCASFDSIVVANCFIAGNFAGEGGGGIVSSGASNTNLIHCTITANRTDGLGGGIVNWYWANCNIVNSILWANRPQQIYSPIERVMELSDSITVYYSDVEGGIEGIEMPSEEDALIWGDGNIDADPLFTAADNGDFTLTENSPCIDAGTAFFVWEEDTLVNLSEDDYQGNAPDMGRFESPYANAAGEEFILYPLSFSLSSFPNPFNASASIRYDLPVSGEVSLRLYDLSGREVCTLFERQVRAAGRYSTTLDGSGLAAGVYLLRLNATEKVMTEKVILLK